MLERSECRRAPRRNSGRRRRSRRNEGGACKISIGLGLLFGLFWWIMNSRSGKTIVDPCFGSNLRDCEDELAKSQAAAEEQRTTVKTLTINLQDVKNKNEHLVAEMGSKVKEIATATSVAKQFFIASQIGLFIAIVASSLPLWILLLFVKHSCDEAYKRLSANEVKAEDILEMLKKIAELTSRLNETTGQLRSERSKNGELLEELEATKKALEDARLPCKRELRLLEIERRIDEKQSERKEPVRRFVFPRPSWPQIDIQKLKSDNSLLGQQLNQVKAENKGLNSALDLAQSMANISSQKLQDARGQVQTLRAENQRLKTASREREDHKKSFTAQLAEAARKLTDSMSVACTLRDANSTLQNRCDRLEVENEKLKGEVSVCRGVQRHVLEQREKLLILAGQLKQQMEGSAGPSGSGSCGQQ